MLKESITNYFILWLSGAVKMYNEREIQLKDPHLTLEFPTNTPTYAIVRIYNKDYSEVRSISKYCDFNWAGYQKEYQCKRP